MLGEDRPKGRVDGGLGGVCHAGRIPEGNLNDKMAARSSHSSACVCRVVALVFDLYV